MTYSNPKEVATLKRKLDQVSQFGCDAFALLFDDIEPEMCKADKEVFQSFGQAQVSVTNDIFNHLSCSRFLFCPTQYCSTRAQPSVTNSEYLNTIGSKLVQVGMFLGNAVLTVSYHCSAFTGHRNPLDRTKGYIKAINRGINSRSDRSASTTACHLG